MRVLLALVDIAACVSLCKGGCNVQVSGVSEDAKKAILKKHNELRAKVANGQQGSLPKAANMLEMEWDEAVAQKAQEWANKCKFKHDSANDRDTGRGYTGQNIASVLDLNQNPDWESPIQGWYNEVAIFDKNSIDEYLFDLSTGHFTQVVWAKTNKIGCGYARYKDGEYFVHLYGCNYLPTGNVDGQPMYEKGEPCSKCGGCGSTPGLCRSKLGDVPETGEDETNFNDENEDGEDTFEYEWDDWMI